MCLSVFVCVCSCVCVCVCRPMCARTCVRVCGKTLRYTPFPLIRIDSNGIQLASDPSTSLVGKSQTSESKPSANL